MLTHLECDGPVVRFTVLLEEQLQPLSGHSRLPAAEHSHNVTQPLPEGPDVAFTNEKAAATHLI